MDLRLPALALVLCLVQDATDRAAAPVPEPVASEVRTTEAGERILVQEVWLDAAVEDVWAAYTTAEGWTAWASPRAEIDLRVGGTILTHYDPDATIGDAGTNTLHVVNYVPLAVLTLRAELGPNWPEVMKEDADKLSNVILFEVVGEERTRVRSYGIGYRDAPEYDDLLGFFVEANERLHRALIAWVEDGERSSFGR